MIERNYYLEQLIAQREQQLIKVVTGVRRCGKSTLFELYITYLKKQGVAEEQIIAINMEDLEFENLTDYRALYQYIQQRLCRGKNSYIFIDEVQNCKHFEKAINSLFIQKQVDIYITGSNAFMLSGELATLLSGRYVTIDMLPLSFKEYFAARGVRQTASKAGRLQEYIRNSSFPYLASIQATPAMTKVYLEGIYSTILLKDIAQRELISDIPLLESVIKTLASGIGSPVSTKKISDTINSGGRKVSIHTIDRYLRALTDSFIFYKVDRYDIKGRQHLKTLGKYYIIDVAIRNYLLAQSGLDYGHVLENIVYLELLHRGYRVSSGKIAEKEVDFVANAYDKIIYFQVSATVGDESTLRRELEPLKKIQDNHAKILLTLDEIGAGTNHDGIQQLNIIDWLLE
ncbi:MAG: ATP-binding protein [Bacillota bacterium]